MALLGIDLGTSSVKALVMDESGHALPGLWYVMGATLNAGLSLKWFARGILGAESYREATEKVSAPPGCEGLVFLPYLTGERTPHMDLLARACSSG